MPLVLLRQQREYPTYPDALVERGDQSARIATRLSQAVVPVAMTQLVQHLPITPVHAIFLVFGYSYGNLTTT